MAERQQALARVVAADPDVANFAASIGPTGGALAPNAGRFLISLKPHGERQTSATQVIDRLRPKLAKVEGARLFLQSAQDINVGGRLSRTLYQYTLQDADLDELNQWAPRLLQLMQSLPQLQGVASDQETNAATVTLTVDRDTAGRFGLPPQAIDDTLYDAFGQRQVAQYFTQLSHYHVVLEVDPKFQADPAALEKIYMKSPLTGQQVPLSSFVTVDRTRVGYLSINHQAQFPSVTLSFNLSPGVALSQAVEAIESAAAKMGRPATLVGNFQGTAQVFQASLKTQPYLITAAILVIYIVLGVLYESYVHPVTILSTLPSAGVGALLALMAFGYEFSVVALIGVLLLIGIVKKNVIMMIDFALEGQRRGAAPEQAIYDACLRRFRPIMMTTMAALLSGVPLMLDSGTGSELRRPLGFTIVGGLLLSQALTLYTTPVVYLYMELFRAWLRRNRLARRLSTVPRALGSGESAAAD
jgi:multidrug efflux pump subunit AcrB